MFHVILQNPDIKEKARILRSVPLSMAHAIPCQLDSVLGGINITCKDVKVNLN